jgi:hypothetical protein
VPLAKPDYGRSGTKEPMAATDASPPPDPTHRSRTSTRAPLPTAFQPQKRDFGRRGIGVMGGQLSPALGTHFQDLDAGW